MNFILEYQNELLALVALLIIFYIYFLIKKINHIIDKKEADANSFAYSTLKPEKEHSKEQLPTETKTDQQEHKPTTRKVNIKSRAVQEHKKIKKEDFAEFAGMKILLAEDNLINQKVILELLSHSNIEVVVANDGLEALNLLKTNKKINLILMDAHMPNMDGFEASRKIRENPEYDKIVIVALSGDIAADDIKKMQEAGMDEHLEKPLKIDALYDIFYAYAPQTALNVEEGVTLCGGDRTFYHDILKEFFKSYEHAGEIIKTYLQHNQIQEASQLLLDIIGLAANIGADRLHDSAQNLRVSLQNGEEKNLELLKDFQNNIEDVLEEIKEFE